MAGEALLARVSSIHGIKGAAFANRNGEIKGSTIQQAETLQLISYLAAMAAHFEQQAGFGPVRSIVLSSDQLGTLTVLAGRQTVLAILAENERAGKSVSSGYSRFLR